MDSDEKRLSTDLEDEESRSQAQAILDSLFPFVNISYETLVLIIPQEEKSEYSIGKEFSEAVTSSAKAISALSDDLEPYCALLSLVLSCRMFRILNTPDPDDLDLDSDFYEGNPGRIINLIPVTSLVDGKIEEIENLEHRSGRQTAILQICYLILAEGELSTGDLEVQALDFIAEACKLPRIEVYPPSLYTFDKQLRGQSLRLCASIENSPLEFGVRYRWDLTDREWLTFWAKLRKTLAIGQYSAIEANVPGVISSEVIKLGNRIQDDLDNSDESYAVDKFNSSLWELLEIAEVFRDGAYEKDIPDAVDPGASDPRGSAYWCWKIGHIVGVTAKFSGFEGIDSIISDRSWFNGSDTPSMALSWHVFSLFTESTQIRDWEQFKRLCMQAWLSLPQDDQSDTDEITPATRSYWAMRIGICDAYLDSEITTHRNTALSRSDTLVGSMEQEIAKQIADRVTTNLLSADLDRRILLNNELGEIKSRLPASNNQIKNFVNDHLASVFAKTDLPGVRSHLIKAERYYRTQVDIDDSKIWFSKAVEGTLRFVFVKGFVEFAKERKSHLIQVVFAGRRGTEVLSTDKVSKLSLGEWSDAFAALNSSSSTNVIAQDSMLGQYLASSFSRNFPDSLDNLTNYLRKVQTFRNSASHFHEDARPEEADRLEEFRNFVFGIRCKSVIESVVEMFTSN